MIIKSIRLKNIKSYGEGPTGTGVTIPLRMALIAWQVAMAMAKPL